MRSSRSWTEAWAVAALLLCVPRPALAQRGDLPASGYGTLRQDEVGVRLGTDNLQLRILPLDERVIRLLAPDTWQSLRALLDSRAADIRDASRGAGFDSATVFLVTFFGLQPRTRFNPDQVNVIAQSILYRPAGIVPLTAGWSDHVVDQRQQVAAIFLFDPAIDVLQPLVMTYGDVSTDLWTTSLRLLEAERQRVFARARTNRP